MGQDLACSVQNRGESAYMAKICLSFLPEMWNIAEKAHMPLVQCKREKSHAGKSTYCCSGRSHS